MNEPMTGKTVLITGATAGIGKATALQLAGLGATVAIVGRDAHKTRRVASEISAATGNPAVEPWTTDLSSQGDIHELASAFTQRHPTLDVLINNAGGYWDARRTTVDGVELTLALNHLAPFLLTHLLLDSLRAAPAARVVTVSSAGQAMGRIDLDDLQGERQYSGQRAYNQSKLANVLFTYELARRLEGTGITANALHPGVVGGTDIYRSDPSRLMRILTPLARPFMISPAKGAATPVHLATSPDVAEVTGRYFVKRRPRRSNKRSYDRELAARLWSVSEELTGLRVAQVAPHAG